MKQWSIDKYLFHEFLAVLNETPTEFFNISKRFIIDKAEFPYGNRVVYLAKSLNVNNRVDLTILNLIV